jgi:hypothetical protein
MECCVVVALFLVSSQVWPCQVRGEQGFEEIPQDSTFIRLVWYDPTLDSTSVGDGVSPPGKGAFRDPIAVFYSPNGTIGEFRAKVKILRFFFFLAKPHVVRFILCYD